MSVSVRAPTRATTRLRPGETESTGTGFEPGFELRLRGSKQHSSDQS
jgi:hypothetical protein